ncbi:barstar family protein [Streptomyces sp. NPDC018029]|uniref:barstar family protein n=1 Tax=Streptomyces sp. NPDC018029 TaxID=3365032 RepID=UPI0037AE951D
METTGGTVHHFDAAALLTEQEIHRGFAKSFRFPGCYGGNWDALVAPLFVSVLCQGADRANSAVDLDGDPLDRPAIAEHFVFEFNEFDPEKIALRVRQPDLIVTVGDGFVAVSFVSAAEQRPADGDLKETLMDFDSALSGFPGVAPLPGMEAAWRWSPNPMFTFTAAASADRGHLLQVNVRGANDEGLVRAVLAFGRERSPEFVGAAAQLTLLEGFRHEGSHFDAVGVAAPKVHGYHANGNPDLNAVTYALFPAFRIEISGRETEEEAWGRFRRMLQPTKLDRTPVPFVKMRYDNTKTRSHSTGGERGFARYATFSRELGLLEGADGSYVEWENRHGQVRRAEWGGGVCTVTLDGGERREMTVAELQELGRADVHS